MALKAGSVLQLPDLACIGLVSKVGDAYLSEKGVYHVIPIEITGKFAGRDGVFFLVFEPRWFSAALDLNDLKTEVDERGRPTKYGMYLRTVNSEAKPSTLVAILGEKFDAFAAEFDGIDEPSADDVANLLRKFAQGEDVLYVMKQRKDEDGKLMEQYNISGFYPYTEETLAYLVEQANNPKRKTPLTVTWDEE